MTDREVMQQALDALVMTKMQISGPITIRAVYESITALSEALEAPQPEIRGLQDVHDAIMADPAIAEPEPSPVGTWQGECIEWTENPHKFKRGQKIYTDPPLPAAQPEQEPLTRDELRAMWMQAGDWDFFRAVDSRLFGSSGEKS